VHWFVFVVVEIVSIAATGCPRYIWSSTDTIESVLFYTIYLESISIRYLSYRQYGYIQMCTHMFVEKKSHYGFGKRKKIGSTTILPHEQSAL
jgi:hypothetical protein